MLNTLEQRIDCSDNDDITLEYAHLLVFEFKSQVKQFVDWFVVKYNRFIESRSRRAAVRVGMPELWEDLKSECIIEAYNIGQRFDPTRGDLLKLLITSLWLYPMRHDIVRRIKSASRGGDESCDVDEIVSKYLATEATECVHSFNDIVMPLEEQDRILLAFKYQMGLPHTVIGALCGLNESTIRSRAERAVEKLRLAKKDEATGKLLAAFRTCANELKNEMPV